MADLFVGIDSGTQGTKVVILDGESRTVVSQAQAGHRLIDDGGTREQDPAWWIAAIEEALRSAMSGAGAKAGDVRAIGVSGQQHGFVALDETGRVLRPAKLWCDTSTASQAEKLVERLGGGK